MGDVLAEVKKALQALVEWTTQHWGDDVELVGEDDLEPMNMIHHDSFGYDQRGETRAEGDRNSGGRVAGDGAASTPAATTRSAAKAHLTRRHLNRTVGAVSPRNSTPRAGL